jgi:hypothetical protein
MRIRGLTLALMIGFAMAGCRKGSPRLEGHWKGTRVVGVDPGVQGQADKYATQLELDFKGDQLTMTTPTGVAQSKYKVVKEDKGSITILSETDGTEESIAFESDNSIQWTVLPGKTISLSKQ